MADKKFTDLPVLPLGSIIPATDVIPVVNGGITKQVTIANAVQATIIAGAAGVASVNTRTGAVTLTSTDVGLANVNNTSDANKPVSTAQQTALDLKANLASPTFTGTVSGITKAMVGLTNVDDTSDVNKPVSTAQSAAINAVSPGRLLGVQIFTSSGTYTPTTGTNSVIVEVQAPGGGSGGLATWTVNSATFYGVGGPGGGGAWGRKRITAGFSGAAVTVGAAGAAAAAGANAGGAGGTTSFGALLSCTGGGGGAGDTPSSNANRAWATAGAGGVATGADISRPGGSGRMTGQPQSNFILQPSGGSSHWGPEAGGAQNALNTAVAGQGYGGGAAADAYASGTSNAARAGAAGAPGIVIVWEYA